MSRKDKEYPYDPILKQYSRQNRISGNPAEVRIWKLILTNHEIMPYKWTRQKPVLNYILDFYCAELKMAIEVDGASHTEKVAYDTMRTQLLSEYSIKVIRYIHNDVLFNIEGIYEDLMEKMKERKREIGKFEERNNGCPPAPLIKGGY
jgi:very-short-patch-repair endonuclease